MEKMNNKNTEKYLQDIKDQIADEDDSRKTLAKLHYMAMGKAEEAKQEKLKGNIDVATSLFNEAFLLEKEAAMTSIKINPNGPQFLNQIIIFRTAIELANGAGKPYEANNLLRISSEFDKKCAIAMGKELSVSKTKHEE